MSKKIIISSIFTILLLQSRIIGSNSTNLLANDKQIFFIDTILIPDPIVLQFKNWNGDSSGYTHSLILVSREKFYNSSVNSKPIFPNYLFSNDSYLFLQSFDIVCLLSNYLYEYPLIDSSLFYFRDLLENSKKGTIWHPFDKVKDIPKTIRGISYFEVYPKKYLLFLINGKQLYQFPNLDETQILNMDNVYFKVAVPFPE